MTKAFYPKHLSRIQNYEEKRQRVARFNLSSDILSSKVLEDPLACQDIVRILTGKPLTIQTVKPQYSIRNLENHSVTLDALAESRTGKLVNVEIQNAENENHLKRSRYIESCIDVSMLEKGTPYDCLPDLYCIFITKDDFLKQGHGIYHVHHILKESGLIIDNGVYEIYANLTGAVKNPVQKALLNYFKNTDVSYWNDKFPNLIKRVRYLKEQKEGVDTMCEILDEERAIGQKLGKLEEAIYVVQNLISMLHLSLEKACEIAGITPETYKEYEEAF